MKKPAKSRPSADFVCRLGRRPHGDDGYFDAMSSAIFRMGFSRDVVEKKWPGIRLAFSGFQPATIAEFGPADVQRLMSDPAVIRNQDKIEAVIDNARALCGLSRASGSFGKFIRRMLEEKGETGLIEELGSRFKRLGPKTALVFLRMTGNEMAETMTGFATKQRNG